MSESADTIVAVARVNGVALHAPAETIAPETLRQRACTELLRQAAQREGLLAAGDAPGTDGAISEAATMAIETLLERALNVPEPSAEACRRHYAAHTGKFATGERARVRHILFAVTPGVDVVALRKRAEATLLDVRCHDGKAGDGFAERGAHAVQLPQRGGRWRPGRLDRGRLRAGVRARDLRQGRDRRAAAARCTAASACTWSRCRRASRA